jgi:hypothetical protein
MPASANSFQFSSAAYLNSESVGGATITVTRLGSTSQPAAVDYSISGNGTASASSDYTPVSGTLHFAVGTVTSTFTVPIIDNAYVQNNRTLNLVLSNPTGGAFLGSPSASTLTIADNDAAPPTTNPLDDAQFFVNEQYLDFLGRQPDLAGLNYWTGQIT